MMESWNVGILGLKSGKWSILKKMLYLHFMMMPVRHPFPAFAPELRSNYEKIKRSDRNGYQQEIYSQRPLRLCGELFSAIQSKNG